MAKGTKTPLDAGIIARAAASIGSAISNWFGPLDPLQPMTTDVQKPSVEGRKYDFPVGINRVTSPRSNEAISFNQLRALSEACDVLRLVIETRKDQLSKLTWDIKPIDEKKKQDKRCDEVRSMFKMPDKEHDWDTWLRMLLEDLFVIDAPAVYFRKTIGGEIYSLEPIDGATIKRVIDEHGRTPLPPEPAYQQILKGIPAINYTTEELIYRPRNVRTHKTYGYSPVEQIVMTVNIALRRSLHQLQYYTEGNVPEAIIGTPLTWGVAQVKEFQQYWDQMLEGNTAERRHAKFVPGELKFQPTKDAALKDEFDEWLARVVCFSFSIAPTPFIKQMNRATAETAHDAAIEEGLAPIMQWVKNLINHIIWVKLGYADLEFQWVDEEATDPLIKAQIDKIYIDAKILHPDEVRADLGREPLTDEQKEDMKPAPAPNPFGGTEIGPDGNPIEPVEDEVVDEKKKPIPPKGKKKDATSKEEVAKAKKSLSTPIDRDRKSIRKLEVKLGKTIAKFLKSKIEDVAKQISSEIGKVEKAAGDSKKKASKIVDDIDFNWDELVDDVSVTLAAVAKDGSAAAMKALGSEENATAQATKWAEDRAAELVGRKWVNGKLVDNPNAEWVITNSTRDMIKGLTAEAIDEGMTTAELADVLSESFAFSEGRASMIARTETAMADTAGQVEAFKESGLVAGTIWVTSDDDLVSEECIANAEAGIVPFGEVYPSGDEAPPAHPNCRCAVVASLIDEKE